MDDTNHTIDDALLGHANGQTNIKDNITPGINSVISAQVTHSERGEELVDEMPVFDIQRLTRKLVT